MKEENLKRLKTALTEHKKLLVKNYCDRDFILTWNNEINNYQGYSEELDIKFGIWPMEYLLQIANGRDKETSLEVVYE